METFIKQSNGRYALGDATLGCGDNIEVLIGGFWIPGRMEHDEDYYILIPDHDNPDKFTKLRPGGMRARRPQRNAAPAVSQELAREMLDALEVAYRSARVVHGAQSEVCVRLENVIAKAKKG